MLSVVEINDQFLGLELVDSGLSLAELMKWPEAERTRMPSLAEFLEYVASKGVRPHPFLSRSCTNMHEDAAATDVSSEAGPTPDSPPPEVDYKDYRGEGVSKIGMISTLAFNSRNEIIAIGARPETRTAAKFSRPRSFWGWARAILAPSPLNFTGLEVSGQSVFSLLRIDQTSLETLETQRLSSTTVMTVRLTAADIRRLDVSSLLDMYARDEGLFFNPHKLFKETGGGAYFFLTDDDKAIAPTFDGTLVVTDTGADAFTSVEIPIPGLEAGDVIAAVAPFWWARDHYWYVTKLAKVGIANLSGVQVEIDLRSIGETDERVNNSFAAGADGAFVVTSKAMYRLDVPEHIDLSDLDPAALVIWRSLYQNDETEKCGQLNAAAGTTPTLVGERFVAITDNSDRMNVVLYDRGSGALVSEVEAFPEAPDGESACDNSLVSFGFSIFAGNTFCYKDPFVDNPQPRGGFSRINVDHRTETAAIAWSNASIFGWSAVPKLSSSTGLIYIYSRELESPDGGAPRWYLRGIDQDGTVVMNAEIARRSREDWFDVYIRTLRIDHWDNGWGPLYLGPDAWGRPTVFASAIQGLIRMRF